MADRLPASVVGGKKRGFNVPMPAWLAGELREFMRDTLSPARVRAQGLFDPAAVERLMSRARGAASATTAARSGRCSSCRSGWTTCCARPRDRPRVRAAAREAACRATPSRTETT